MFRPCWSNLTPKRWLTILRNLPEKRSEQENIPTLETLPGIHFRWNGIMGRFLETHAKGTWFHKFGPTRLRKWSKHLEISAFVCLFQKWVAKTNTWKIHILTLTYVSFFGVATQKHQQVYYRFQDLQLIHHLPSPKFNSSPVESCKIPLGKAFLPTTIFQGLC